MIRAVLYDMGDIFFEAHYWRKWNYEKLVASGNFKGTFTEFYDLYESFLVPVYEGSCMYDKAFDDFLVHLQVKDTSFKKDSFAQKLFFETTRTLHDHVAETLLLIRQMGIKNVVITDNELSEQEIRANVIDRFGINHLIDKVISSKETGVKKPDPEIFEIALSSIHMQPEEVLFVAHDEDEINGAKAIGIRVIGFNNYLERPIQPDFYIKEFKEIESIISSTCKQ